MSAHSSTIARFLLMTSAVGFVLNSTGYAAEASSGAGDDPFADLVPMGLDELMQARGGYSAGGFKFSIGVTVSPPVITPVTPLPKGGPLGPEGPLPKGSDHGKSGSSHGHDDSVSKEVGGPSVSAGSPHSGTDAASHHGGDHHETDSATGSGPLPEGGPLPAGGPLPEGGPLPAGGPLGPNGALPGSGALSSPAAPASTSPAPTAPTESVGTGSESFPQANDNAGGSLEVGSSVISIETTPSQPPAPEPNLPPASVPPSIATETQNEAESPTVLPTETPPQPSEVSTPPATLVVLPQDSAADQSALNEPSPPPVETGVQPEVNSPPLESTPPIVDTEISQTLNPASQSTHHGNDYDRSDSGMGSATGSEPTDDVPGFSVLYPQNTPKGEPRTEELSNTVADPNSASPDTSPPQKRVETEDAPPMPPEPEAVGGSVRTVFLQDGLAIKIDNSLDNVVVKVTTDYDVRFENYHQRIGEAIGVGAVDSAISTQIILGGFAN